MMRIIYVILLLSSSICLNVASDNILNMPILTNFATDLLKIYENYQPQNVSIMQNMFAEINNFTNSFQNTGIHLRFDTESVNFSSCWKIPDEIHNDLEKILVGTFNINEFFRSYYIDFLDGVYDNNLVRLFVARILMLDVESPLSEIKMIHEKIFTEEVDENKNNLFDKLTEKLNKIVFCEKSATKQQFLASLYSFILQSELRAFVMITTASELQHLLPPENFTTNITINIQSLKKEFIEKWNNYLKIMQKALAKTSTEFYNCLPSYGYGLNDVYAINLSPTVVDEPNKVVVGAKLEVRDGFLNLLLYQDTFSINGKILSNDWSYSQITPKDRHLFGMTYHHGRTFNFPIPGVEFVPENFWKNISFLHTTVPENHVVVGANFELLKLNPEDPLAKKILYFRLHCAKVNITTGIINMDNVSYTKVWTKDDPELNRLLENETEKDQSFEDDKIAQYKSVEVKNGPLKERGGWRREPALNSYVDSNSIQVDPRLPITGIGFYKNKHKENSHYLSIKISTLDISPRINSNTRLL